MTATAAVRERPIIMSSEMVRAILDGRKTQTRRVIRPVQPREDRMWPAGRDPRPDCPYGVPGDRLWVRETLRKYDSRAWYYAADKLPLRDGEVPIHNYGQETCSSIHMPHWASRLTLEITEVRVQRVQEISEEDAITEGVAAYADAHLSRPNYLTPIEQFQYLWRSLNAKRGYPWDANPWVWALSFRPVSKVTDV